MFLLRKSILHLVTFFLTSFDWRPIVWIDDIIMIVATLLIPIVCLFYRIIFALISDAAIINNSTDISSFRPQKGNECKDKQPYAWCIPVNYNKVVSPWEYRHLTNKRMPWNYHFKFYISNIHEINEHSQTLKISMYFESKWHEPRLRANKSANTWGSKDYVSTSVLKSNYFWHPDIIVLLII